MKMLVLLEASRNIQTQKWWLVTMIVMVTMVIQVTSLSGPNVCMVKQKYNITKRVKYRAPMSIRTYEWCFAMPPRCSKWNTEMRDVTRLETEERTAEMAVCCPGYKLKDVSCVPACPNGKTGPGCSEECPPNKWGPNCVYDCKKCKYGSCDVITGDCRCQDGWQGESCETSMTTTAVAMMEQILTAKATTSTKTTTQTIPTSSFIPTTATAANSTISPEISTSNLTSTEKILTSTPSNSKKIDEFSSTPTSDTTIIESSVIFNNMTFTTLVTKINTYKETKEATKRYLTLNSSYNRTENPTEMTKVIPVVRPTIATEPITIEFKTETTSLPTTTKLSTKTIITATNPRASTAMTFYKETMLPTVKLEATRNLETTARPTTTKFKPKEIWIRPAQKGESPLVESKIKTNQEQPHLKFKIKDVSEVTTPKTIIVSIIPTSVSYITFKKLALTTASTFSSKNTSIKTYNKSTEQEHTKSMTVQTTAAPITIKMSPRITYQSTTVKPVLLQNVTKPKSYNVSSTPGTIKTTVPTNKTTNSMLRTLNVANKKLNSSLLTTISSFPINANTSKRKQYPSSESSTIKPNQTTKPPFKNIILPDITEKTTTMHPTVIKQFITVMQRNLTVKRTTNPVTEPPKVTETILRKQTDTNSRRNLTNSNTKTNTVTDDPSKDEESFHILTEPEHITAVMGDKGTERSTIDLISVISIAGGVMMAIITVAVVIVMLERCRKPRYEDVRKYNDMRMQVMIENNDVPPPYVRSIFHTPLPDPPIEKCHYQPISTLDRNLKQFMRPVVVQTISPLMLENFRGILECHYDHLPRRSQDMGTLETRCSVAPSMGEREELLPNRVCSLTESDIEAMKCEARQDVLDNTTSEPLYAEIPCWRPPSAHAIEVVNLNGEAVTEL